MTTAFHSNLGDKLQRYRGLPISNECLRITLSAGVWTSIASPTLVAGQPVIVLAHTTSTDVDMFVARVGFAAPATAGLFVNFMPLLSEFQLVIGDGLQLRSAAGAVVSLAYYTMK